MSITEQQTTSIPTGNWTADVVHSAVSFEVLYMGIASFSGAVTDFQATLVDGRLAGSARIASLETTIDRTEFGILWNAPMPDGSKALADEVTLKADLSLVKAA